MASFVKRIILFPVSLILGIGLGLAMFALTLAQTIGVFWRAK